MDGWETSESALDPGHAWRARPGCSVFVAGRGAVRFDYPREWVFVPDDDAAHLYDQRPPDDSIRLTASYVRLPLLDWHNLPVSDLLENAMLGEDDPPSTLHPINALRRDDLQIAWRAATFTDPSEFRQACTNVCIARRARVQCLITFDFWESDRERAAFVWNTVIETLIIDGLAAPELGMAAP